MPGLFRELAGARPSVKVSDCQPRRQPSQAPSECLSGVYTRRVQTCWASATAFVFCGWLQWCGAFCVFMWCCQCIRQMQTANAKHDLMVSEGMYCAACAKVCVRL